MTSHEHAKPIGPHHTQPSASSQIDCLARQFSLPVLEKSLAAALDGDPATDDDLSDEVMAAMDTCVPDRSLPDVADDGAPPASTGG